METKKITGSEKVVENLRKIMYDRGLTQRAFADYINVTESQISKILKLECRISIDQLSLIASALDMSVVDIFTYPVKFVPQKEIEERVSASITINLNKDQKRQMLNMLFTPKQLKDIDL